MYIPKHFKGGRDEAIAFMKQYSFGVLITSIENNPIATHLPFTICENNDAIYLTSHVSKMNEQWKHIESNENLIIFSEPHAYISPQHYREKENVPTWNYLAVHAYGKAKLIDQQDEVFASLESMMNSYDAQYKKQWQLLPMNYKIRKSKGIIAFQIKVSRLEYKEKLSQNKTLNERKVISEFLSKSDNTNEANVGRYMTLKAIDDNLK